MTARKTSLSTRYLRILHDESPLRVWSLIVTIFGDAVMAQGTDDRPAPIWIAHLLEVLELLGIEPGIARTNLSRLVANGTLERDKSGRNTFYRLAGASAADFAAAARLIYGKRKLSPTGYFHIAQIDWCDERKAARKILEDRGFRFVSTTTALLPEHQGQALRQLPGGVLCARAAASPLLAKLAREAWRLEELGEGYRRFVAHFRQAPAPRHEADALIQRLVAVHLFRRLALRDPHLAGAALPDGFAGGQARIIFDDMMARLARPSETWLKAHGFRGGHQDFASAKEELQRNM